MAGAADLPGGGVPGTGGPKPTSRLLAGLAQAAASFGLPSPVAAGARHQSSFPDDQGRDFLRRSVSDRRQHRGIRVGGQHDAGMTQHLLHDPQIHARSQGQGGRAKPQVMRAP